jgi:hypothetical protein
MITTFEAGSVFKIIDEATPTLRAMSRGVATFDKAVNAARLNLEKLNAVKLAPVAGELKLITDSAIALRPEVAGLSRSLGTLDRRMAVLPGTAKAFSTELTSAFTAISTGATAALADMRALTAETRTLAVSSRAASRAALLPGRAAAGGGGGHSRGGFHVSGLSQRIPGGHVYFHGGNNAAMAALGALGYGIYEESEIEDIAARAMITGQIKVDAGMRNSAAFQAIRDTIGAVSTQTGFSPKEVGEAILTTERQFGGLDFMKRLDIEKTLLPYAAAEARLKETSLPEAFQALVGLVHMTGTYDPKQLPELARSFAYTSMITPVELPRFERALSYSLPILHAGMNMDPSAVMFLTSMAQTAGITNTKSGTWIREFFARLMPDTSGTKRALEHNRLEQQLGLLDAQNKPTWFVKDAAGKVDWMPSLSNLSRTMSTELAKIPDTERLGVMKQVWGAQGGGFGALMNLPQFVDQISVLAEKMKAFQGGETVLDQLTAGSPVQQARNAFADLQKVLMDIGGIALPPVVRSLEVVDGVLKRIDNVLPKPGTPGGDTVSGMTTGALIGFGLGKFVGQPLAGAGIGAFLGGTYALEGWAGILGAGAGFAFGNPVVGAKIGGEIGRWWDSDPKREDFTVGLLSKLEAMFAGVKIESTPVAVNMDGQKVAEIVIKHEAKVGAGPAEGAPYHDPTYSTSPLDFALPN